MTLQDNTSPRRRRRGQQPPKAPQTASELYLQIGKDNPDIEDRVQLMCDQALQYQYIAAECIEFWARMNDRKLFGARDEPEPTPTPPIPDEKIDAAKAWFRKQLVHLSLEFPMPDGRKLGDWTGDEGNAFVGSVNKAFVKAGSKRLRDVFRTDTELQKACK